MPTRSVKSVLGTHMFLQLRVFMLNIGVRCIKPSYFIKKKAIRRIIMPVILMHWLRVYGEHACFCNIAYKCYKLAFAALSHTIISMFYYVDFLLLTYLYCLGYHANL